MIYAKVLVVDNNSNIARILTERLKVSGFEPLICTLGDRVVSVIQSLHPDIVLLNLMLPDITGFKICKEIRLFSDVPIIMMSDKASYNERLEGFRVGADDFVDKPFCTEELIFRIESVMKRSRIA